MTKPFIIKPRFCIENSELCSVGEDLGLDWNDVCDILQEHEIYGQDGSGYIVISSSFKSDNEDLNNIFTKIFSDNPSCSELYILNDF